MVGLPAPHRRSSKRSIVKRIAATAGSLVLVLVGLAAPAGAVTTCTYSAATQSVSILVGTDDTAALLVSAAAITMSVNGGAFAACGAATVNNTTSVSVVGSNAGNEAFTIDLAGGGFGAINFSVDLANGTDTLRVLGGSSADTTSADASGIDLNGDANLDVSVVNAEVKVIDGGGGADTINASAAVNAYTLAGGGGADTLIGGAAGDTISGGSEDDSLEGRGGNDALDGGPGNDRASYANAPGPVTIDLGAGTACCGDGSDTLISIESAIASPFGGSIIGDAGDNLFVATNGNDSFNGAGGSDTIDYSSAPAGVTVNLALTTPQVTGGSGTDTLLNFENVIGSAFADTLLGTPGPNTLNGGLGPDTASYANASAGVVISLRTDKATGGGGSDTLISIENTVGSPFDDRIAGDVGANAIDGANGIDTIDYSEAGSGAASPGIAGPVSGVSIDLSNTGPQPTGADGTDTVSDVENVVGSSLDDHITGDAAGNEVEGGEGDDEIVGGGGSDIATYDTAQQSINADLGQGTVTGAGVDSLVGVEGIHGSPLPDTIAGSDGDDELVGGAGSDVVSYDHAHQGVTVNLGAGTATGQGVDSVTGFERIVGSSGADSLTGNSLPNTIRGGAGADEIFGLGAADRLVGGAGPDTVKGHGGPDRAIGGPADDELFGGGDADELLGRAGFDTCVGGPAADTFQSCEERRN